MKTINYESDFKLIEGFKDGSSILAAPFRFTYYTKVSRGVYVAEYNGSEFVNCILTEDGKVIVPFDSPKLGMGVLMVKREFFLNDSDFKDGICNLVSVESTGITLDKGATDDLGEIEVLIEPYYHTVNGGGDIENGSITEIKLADDAVSTTKIKDGAVTEDKLSEEVKKKLNQQSGGYEPPVGGIPRTDLSDDVQASLSKADTALQEHQDVSSYATLAKVQEVAEGLVTKDAHTSDIQGLQSSIEEVASDMITAEPAEGEEVEDYVLMKSDVDKEIDSNSNNPVTNEAIARALEAAVARGRELAKRDLYIAAGAEYNDTDEVVKKTAFWGAEVDHLPHHYYLNGLGDITEEQMSKIYNNKEAMTTILTTPGGVSRYYQTPQAPRTLFGHKDYRYSLNRGFSSSYVFSRGIEVVDWAYNVGWLSTASGVPIMSQSDFFYQCDKIYAVNAFKCSVNVSFSNSDRIRYFRIYGTTAISLNLSKSTIVDKASLLHFIQSMTAPSTSAASASVKAITLHPDVYAEFSVDEEINAALVAKNEALSAKNYTLNLVSA